MWCAQEVEIALAEEAFQRDKAQLAELWAQRAHQFQQAVDLQVFSIDLPLSKQEKKRKVYGSRRHNGTQKQPKACLSATSRHMIQLCTRCRYQHCSFKPACPVAGY